MDEILKAEQNRLVAVKEGEDAVVKFKRGDEVEVFVGPFAGRTGVVQCSGEKPIIRLLMGVRYVNLPRAMLKIAVDAAK
jgi:transcription antitermination factor NusG